MDRKPCTLCGVEKPLDDFAPDARGKGGRQARCRPCAYAAQEARRSPAQRRTYLARSRQRHTAKQRARNQLRRAIQRGEVVRPDSCERCGKPGAPEGHHPSYDAPLAVVWLCRACHGKEHRKAS